MKSLVDMCLFCVAGNLGTINRAGTYLSRFDKEKLLLRLCDHDMLSAERLPQITYHLFASHLRTVTFSYSDQVNDSLLVNLAECGCALKEVTLNHCFRITDKGLAPFLKTQTELKYVKLKSLNITDKSTSTIKSKDLSTVHMKCLEQITNASIVTMVKNCTNICEIKISRCYKVSDGAVQAITDTLETKLEILNLNNQRLITDLSLMALGACPNLKELNINGCNITTGNGLQMVTTSCPKLSCLDIGYCYRACRNGPCFITAEFLPASLTELTLHGIQLPGDLITKLAQRLSKIKILRLCGIQAVDDTVLEEVCSTAGGTLVELDLSACSAITDDGLSAIPRHCYVIESLILSFCSKVTGRRLFPLLEDPKRAAEIRVMIANGCKAFSIDVIRKLAMSCPNLETLLLAGLKEMDDEMVSIVARQCPKLQAINLKGCELVTDAGVSELARLCPLAHVVVSGIHSLTDKSVFALTNGCASTLKVVYASACTKMTTQAINYLKDCCLRRVFVEHRTPNLEPGQLMALNLDTGEYCRADLLFPQAPHT